MWPLSTRITKTRTSFHRRQVGPSGAADPPPGRGRQPGFPAVTWEISHPPPSPTWTLPAPVQQNPILGGWGLETPKV